METIEKTILRNLISNEEYFRKVFPFLKLEYFSGEEQLIFTKISDFIGKYNERPPLDAIEIACQNDKNIPEKVYKSTIALIEELREGEPSKSFEWLNDKTEEFCKKKAVYNAILQSIRISEGQDKTLSEDAIPSLLQDALSVCFDNSIGHDYIEDASVRFDFYNKQEERLPFDIEILNKITQGGLIKKTLNMLLSPTGVGKTMVMCHFAAAWLRMGYNVLYITLEMAEERIAERIDANLLGIELSQLPKIPKEMYVDRIGKINEKTQGKLIIKEYPTSSAHVNHFRTLINDLQLKKKFKPAVIIVDYLNICASSRYRPGPNVNSYTLVKGIAEELRALAVEYDVPIVSATQSNRSGYENSDTELTDTSESIGLPMTVDLMLALISTEELEQLNQLLIKQLKTRYSDMSKYKRFVIGIDRAKMRLFDLEEGAQINIQSGTNVAPQQKSSFSVARRPTINSSRSNVDFGGFKT